MTLVALPTPLLWPTGMEAGSTPSHASALMDATGEKVGWVGRAPKAGTIAKVGFRTGTVTTPQSLDARLEGVGTDGNPSGSLWATNTNGTQAAPASDTWYWVTLTAGAIVAKNDPFAVVVAWVSTVGNLNIAYAANGMTRDRGAPFAALYTGTWARQTAAHSVVACEYSDGSRPYIDTVPVATFAGASYGTSTTPDEWGNRIAMPFRCKVGGIFTRVTKVATTFAVKLYGTDGTTVLASTTGLDGDVQAGTSTPSIIWFASDVTLEYGAVHRFTVLPETATVVANSAIVVDSAATMEAVAGGAGMYWTERTDAGAWTDTTTKRSLMGLVITALEDGIVAPQPQFVLGVS